MTDVLRVLAAGIVAVLWCLGLAACTPVPPASPDASNDPLPGSAAPLSDSSAEPPNRGNDWPRATLPEVGTAPAPIEALADAIGRGRYVAVDSLLIARHGKLAAEYYFSGFGPDTRHQTRSSFKSVAGLLLGIAIDEGHIALDDRISPLIALYHLPRDRDPRKRQITVSHLLDMASGLDCREMPNSGGPYRENAANSADNQIAGNFEIPMADTPGLDWRYCSSNTVLLGVALEAALARTGGGSTESFLNRKLMDPLGIDYRQAYTDRGVASLKGGQRMRPLDMAKIGQLILSRGQWKDRRIVPADWIDAMLSDGRRTGYVWTDLVDDAPALQRPSRYRSQWFQTWMPVGDRDVRLIHSWGNGGQFIIAVPALDLLIVTTGSNYGAAKIAGQKQIFDMLYRVILPAIAS